MSEKPRIEDTVNKVDNSFGKEIKKITNINQLLELSDKIFEQIGLLINKDNNSTEYVADIDPEFKSLGFLEEFILQAIICLKENAYGISIRKQIENWTNKKYTNGTIHSTIRILVKKGFINSYMSHPTNRRGGRSKKMFTVTETGLKILDQANHIRRKIQHDIIRLIGK